MTPSAVAAQVGLAFGPDDCDGAALLRLLELKGIAGLNRVRAMFGLAMFDPEDGSVLLARDAWGQKPLYVRRFGAGWAFASTLAALRAGTGPMRVRQDAMLEALIFKSVGGHASSFEEVEQLPPGSWMRIFPDGRASKGRWHEPSRAEDAEPRAVKLQRLLTAAIEDRCPDRFRASIFLSGGLDSSIVAAVAAKNPRCAAPHVLTIGYDVGGWQDEHELALRLADELGLESDTIILRGGDAPELLYSAVAAMEDPNHDPVVVPTLALTRQAAGRTKVVLTGDGSDEFWGGYARFDEPPATLDEYLRRTMVFSPEDLGLDAIPPSYLEGIDTPAADAMPPLDRYMRVETRNRMRNYHLSRVDKLSMAVGLEARSPFLDLHVTAFADSLPAAEKRAGGRPKGLLIDAFSDVLPEWLLNRRKQPFTVPIQKWLNGPLRSCAHDLLESPNAFVRQFTEPAQWLRALPEDRVDEKAAMRVWSLLCLEIWALQTARSVEAAA